MKIQDLWSSANDAAVKLEAFNGWTRTFEIPDATGEECTVRGSRVPYEFETDDGQIQHEYDFAAFYLNGDCDKGKQITITIERKPQFWRQNLYYEDEDNVYTELTESPGNCANQRSFILRPDGTIASFRINTDIKVLKPEWPFDKVILDDV